jgi:hypothetical protein
MKNKEYEDLSFLRFSRENAEGTKFKRNFPKEEMKLHNSTPVISSAEATRKVMTTKVIQEENTYIRSNNKFTLTIYNRFSDSKIS